MASSGSDAKQNGDDVQLQFINLSGSTRLDKTSRTTVRTQVMREFHRKRVKEPLGNVLMPPPATMTKVQPSAASQTQKFRMEQKQFLRPWVARKQERSKTLKNKKKNQPQDVHVETLPEPVEREFRGPAYVPQLNDNASGRVDEADGRRWLASIDLYLRRTPLYHALAADSVDPFASTSLLITPHIKQLLHHYFSERLRSSWLMMPMRKGLLSLAISDAALFHTLMTHYVARFQIRFQVGDPAENAYHKNQAIKLVNEQLEASSTLSDGGLVAAVANMATYEASNGSLDSVEVHWKGLVEMVKIRGGIRNGSFSPFVKRLIGWTDMHCATALAAPPRMPRLEMDVLDPSLASPSTSFNADGESEDEINYLFREIRKLSATMQQLQTSATAPREDIWYSDRIYFLQRSLYEIIHCSKAPGRVTLDKACALVALAFCGHCLRDIPLSFRVISSATTKLMIATQEFLLSETVMSEEAYRRMMFVLGFGGTAAEGMAERTWFVGEFRRLCEILGLGGDEVGWRAVKGFWEGVMWHERLGDGGYRFWREAMARD